MITNHIVLLALQDFNLDVSTYEYASFSTLEFITNSRIEFTEPYKREQLIMSQGIILGCKKAKCVRFANNS